MPEICGDIAGPPNGEANDNRDKNERYSLFHCRFYALHGSPCFGLPARPWVVMAGRAAMSLHLPPKLWASASPRRKATLSGDIRLTATKECGGRDLLSQPRTTQGWAAASDAFGFCGDKIGAGERIRTPVDLLTMQFPNQLGDAGELLRFSELLPTQFALAVIVGWYQRPGFNRKVSGWFV